MSLSRRLQRQARRNYLAFVDGPWCQRCWRGDIPVNELTIDHIKPRGLGGTDKQDNTQLLCLSCNGRKGDAFGLRERVELNRQREASLKTPMVDARRWDRWNAVGP